MTAKSISSLTSVNLTVRDAVIVRKTAGYVLFNKDGKMVAVNEQPGPVYRLANKIGFKLSNEESVKGQEILKKTKFEVQVPVRRPGVVVENVIRA